MVSSPLVPAQHLSWRVTPCRVSATAYSIYFHLSPISGGRLFRPQLEDTPCYGDKGHTSYDVAETVKPHTDGSRPSSEFLDCRMRNTGNHNIPKSGHD
jgi:hypothetical protein